MPDIFLTADGAGKIAGSDANRGLLSLNFVAAEDFYVVDLVEIAHEVRIRVVIPAAFKVLNWSGPTFNGQWMKRAADEINLHHLSLLHRPTHVFPFDAFRELVEGVEDPGSNLGFLITYDPDIPQGLRDLGVEEYAGWLISRQGVKAMHLDVEPSVLGIRQLDGKWPVAELLANSAMVVGCGSIGSAAAEALARFGIGRIELVDPDRLRWHNLLRHTLTVAEVGAYKVSGLSQNLSGRWPEQKFNAHRLDVVTQAHEVRPLIEDVDIVLCAADGIASRRVVSHLSRRAKKPAVLAAVLEQGAIGEIIRLRPSPRFGCLLCLRQELADAGAMDAEAAQEMDYGAGSVHLPMTAVPPDLNLIGTLSAKVAVSTLLESLHGEPAHRIPDEHLLVGLRANKGLPPPFDLDRSGELRWRPIPKPRPSCATCNP